MPFHKALDETDAAHQLGRTIKRSLIDIIARCDDQCSDVLGTPTGVPRWERLFRKCIHRAITPDKRSNFDITYIFHDFFRKVKRSLLGGAGDPDTFMLLLRLISTLFDHGDRSAAIAKLPLFGVATRTIFTRYFRAVRLLIASVTDSERVRAPSIEAV